MIRGGWKSEERLGKEKSAVPAEYSFISRGKLERDFLFKFETEKWKAVYVFHSNFDLCFYVYIFTK